ncbi:MAG TPA: IPT/TIG domain-containing protein [Vicinamibacteria bacterium]|nr:IPT/TIG domain-containing protein [Vicinamibacteria bacterium]
MTGGPADGSVFPLSKGTGILVGSGRLAQLRLDAPEVGAAHARVDWDDSGISITDNGSSTGTFVNGEQVETAMLLDGDRVSFVPADAKNRAQVPRLLVRIPPGSVLVAPPPPSPVAPSAAPTRPPSRERATAPPSSFDPVHGPARADEVPARAVPPPARDTLPPKRWGPERVDLTPMLARLNLAGLSLNPVVIGVAVGALAVGLGLVLLASRLLFGAPVLSGTQPGLVEAGQALTISGKRFDPDPSRDTVWFGDQTAPATSATDSTVTVVVPLVPAVGSVLIAVETPHGRSDPLSVRVRTPLQVTSFEPEAALPGEEVTARGQGFAEGPALVNVAGKSAQVLEAAPARLRFKVPDIPVEPGVPAPVIVRVGNATARPVDLLLGHLPYVLEVSPLRGGVGDLVTLKGRGFAPDPAANAVTIGGVAALVVTASPHELRVVAPAAGGSQAQAEAPVVVGMGGRVSTNRAVFTVQRSPGAFVLRFFATAVGAEGGRGRAFVATEVGPLLLLASADDAPSVPERALRVSAALTEVADALRAGRPAALEARDQPVPGVGVVGGQGFLVRATAEDAAAYSAPPGLGTKTAVPSLRVLASFWAALLNDYLTLFVLNERPMRLLAGSPRGGALSDLGVALGWRPGVSVPSERVLTLSPDLARRLRELALLVPPEGQTVEAAAVEGTWEGEMTEESGSKSIIVRFRLEGSQVMGSLTTRTGGVAMDVPLKEISFQKGMLRFRLPSGTSPRTFVGRLEGSSLSGTLHASATGPALGRFVLKYAP